MLAKPSVLLRVEGAAMFACSLFLYHSLGARWGEFFALCLWPDLFMLGYLANARLGARLYNLVHMDALPLALAVVTFGLRQPGPMAFAFIWLAHIGWDRTLGYGLKYPTFFKDTHLQRVIEPGPVQSDLAIAGGEQVQSNAVRTDLGSATYHLVDALGELHLKFIYLAARSAFKRARTEAQRVRIFIRNG